MSTKRVPVTLLTGFLGSGKTTLVNHILTAEHGRRIAVIVNEFGDVGIDGQLIAAEDDGIIELTNGCICCTVQADLQQTLEDLLRRRRRRFFKAQPFEAVLIEASGMASPGPAVQTLLAVPELEEAFEVDGIIALAHAQHIGKQLCEHPEAAEQVAYADVLLLNHTDQVEEAQVNAAESALVQCNADASIVRTSHARVPVETILGTRAFDYDRWTLGQSREGGHPGEHRHTSGVSTIALRTNQPLDLLRLKMWLQFLVNHRQHELMRLKGILHCVPHETGVVAQGIYQWIELIPGDELPPEESVLVLIGRDLDPDQIQRGWQASMAKG